MKTEIIKLQKVMVFYVRYQRLFWPFWITLKRRGRTVFFPSFNDAVQEADRLRSKR